MVQSSPVLTKQQEEENLKQHELNKKEFEAIERGFIKYIRSMGEKENYKHIRYHEINFNENSFKFHLAGLYFNFKCFNYVGSSFGLYYSFYSDTLNYHHLGTTQKDIITCLNEVKKQIKEFKDKYGVFISPVSLFVEYLEEYVEEVY